MKKIILLSAFILTIAFGLCGCKKDDTTVHFASETEQTAVVSSDVNRQTADSKEKKASSDGEQEQNHADFGQQFDRVGIFDQPEGRGAAQDAGQQKADDGRYLDLMADEKHADGKAEDGNDVRKKRYVHAKGTP